MNITSIFRGCERVVGVIPESVSRNFFTLIGTFLGYSNLKGVRQLRKNYQRIVPLSSNFAQRRRSAQAMRKYFQYYHEVFRLPHLSPSEIDARVIAKGMDPLKQELLQRSAVATLLHSGNWDLAGAWAARSLAPVHTLAEKLEPADLAQHYRSFREKLGMTIYFAVKGENAIGKLQSDLLQNKCFVPLLCDRDLSASGIEVELLGEKIRVAPGAALLAIRENIPVYPIFIKQVNFSQDRDRVKAAGTKFGIQLELGQPIFPPQDALEDISEALQKMNQLWIAQAEQFLKENLTDWHMLQKIFVADLDPERLAKARALKQTEIMAEAFVADDLSNQSEGNPR